MKRRRDEQAVPPAWVIDPTVPVDVAYRWGRENGYDPLDVLRLRHFHRRNPDPVEPPTVPAHLLAEDHPRWHELAADDPLTDEGIPAAVLAGAACDRARREFAIGAGYLSWEALRAALDDEQPTPTGFVLGTSRLGTDQL